MVIRAGDPEEVVVSEHAYVIVLTTMPPGPEALGLARTLVDERLAACVNVLPEMQSIYRWADGIQQDGEQQLLIKTAAARVARLQARLAELHPYDLPECVVVPVVAGSEAYLDWVGASVR